MQTVIGKTAIKFFETFILGRNIDCIFLNDSKLNVVQRLYHAQISL